MITAMRIENRARMRTAYIDRVAAPSALSRRLVPSKRGTEPTPRVPSSRSSSFIGLVDLGRSATLPGGQALVPRCLTSHVRRPISPAASAIAGARKARA